MRFWDSSALTPLLVDEADSDSREKQLQEDPEILVWYGTLVEIESALNRRIREGFLSSSQERLVRNRLQILAKGWFEVQPTLKIRQRAIRLLRVHPLRAADSFQLAAALIACDEQPDEFHFLTADQRLTDAATKEGFRVY